MFSHRLSEVIWLPVFRCYCACVRFGVSWLEHNIFQVVQKVQGVERRIFLWMKWHACCMFGGGHAVHAFIMLEASSLYGWAWFAVTETICQERARRNVLWERCRAQGIYRQNVWWKIVCGRLVFTVNILNTTVGFKCVPRFQVPWSTNMNTYCLRSSEIHWCK